MAWGGLQLRVQVLELFVEEGRFLEREEYQHACDARREQRRAERAQANRERLPPDERKRRWTEYNAKNRERINAKKREIYRRHMATPEGRAKLAEQARIRNARARAKRKAQKLSLGGAE